MHVTIVPAVKRIADDTAPAFAKMVADGIQAVIIFSDPVEYTNRLAIIAAAARHRIPAGYFWKVEAEEGGLLACSADNEFINRRAAEYVAKIPQGARPADLPIEQPDRFTTVINLRTAKELGITMPTSLLLRADKVIE